MLVDSGRDREVSVRHTADVVHERAWAPPRGREEGEGRGGRTRRGGEGKGRREKGRGRRGDGEGEGGRGGRGTGRREEGGGEREAASTKRGNKNWQKQQQRQSAAAHQEEPLENRAGMSTVSLAASLRGHEKWQWFRLPPRRSAAILRCLALIAGPRTSLHVAREHICPSNTIEPIDKRATQLRNSAQNRIVTMRPVDSRD